MTKLNEIAIKFIFSKLARSSRHYFLPVTLACGEHLRYFLVSKLIWFVENNNSKIFVSSDICT